MIEVSHLTRRYGETAAVDDVSFVINPGEVVGLLGHNGAGKTTIMKMLTGFIEPSGGKALIDGMDVQEEPLAVQAKIGYLPESLPIYPELTVADYLAHAANLRGLAPEESVLAALQSTQMTDRAFDRIDTLSRGYKQRLGVAQAILHRPKFLILDEPSNGLDPSQIRHMRALLRSLAETSTVILSTHIMQEVNAVCDRALIMSGGKLVVDENLSDLRKASQATLRTIPDADIGRLMAPESAVTSVSASGPGQWILQIDGDVDQAVAKVASVLVANELPVYSLTPAVRDLETVFTEINQADAEVTDAA